MKTKTKDDSIKIIENDCMTQQRSLSLNTITSVSNKATENDTKSVRSTIIYKLDVKNKLTKHTLKGVNISIMFLFDYMHFGIILSSWLVTWCSKHIDFCKLYSMY
jgi:hypothetical protein